MRDCPRCKGTGKLSRPYNKVIPEKKCEICGLSYKPRRNSAVVCSRKCNGVRMNLIRHHRIEKKK
jgi:predicted nucleic acid-binding Zn ribbon protein